MQFNPLNYAILMFELCILLFICMAMGRRCATLLPNCVQRMVGFYLSPILGLSCLILITTVYGWLSPFSTQFSLLVTSVLVIFCFYFEKRKKQLFFEWLQICLFAFICSLPIMAPIIHFGGYNPSTDIFTYLVQGQWLQEHSFSEQALASGYYPALTQVVLYQTAGSRMGASFILGYVQSLFALKWSYYAYIPAVSLAFVTGCLALGGIVKQVIRTKKIIILAMAAIPCFSMNGFIFGAEWGFFPQTFGLALATGVSVIIPSLTTAIIYRHYSWQKIIRFSIPASICTAALLFAYNEPFPIFVAAMVLYFTISLLVFKSKSLLILFFIYAGEVLILINYEAVRIARNLLQTISISKQPMSIGWPVLWSPMQFAAYAFGMKSPFDSHIYSMDYINSTFVFAILLIMLVVLFSAILRKKNKPAIIFLLCVDLVLLLAFLKFRYFSEGRPDEIGATFLQYKIAKYAAPFSLALIGIAGAYLWRCKIKLRPYLVSIYFLAGMAGLYFQCYYSANNLTTIFLDETRLKEYPFDQLLKLRTAVSKIPKNETIYVALGSEHLKLRQMVAYILYDRKIASNFLDDGYIFGHLPENERNISSRDLNWLISVDLVSRDCEGSSDQQIGLFYVKHAPFNYILQEKSEGAYATESNVNGDTWNWIKDSADFYFNNRNADHKVKLKFKLVEHSLAPEKLFSIELKNLSGTVLARYKIPAQSAESFFESDWIKINSDHLILHVESSGKPLRLSAQDGRRAKFAIANIAVCSTN